MRTHPSWLLWPLALLIQGCADITLRATPAPVSEVGRPPPRSSPVARPIPPAEDGVRVYPYQAPAMAGTLDRGPPDSAYRPGYGASPGVPPVSGQPYPYGIPDSASPGDIDQAPPGGYAPGYGMPPPVTGQPYAEGFVPETPAAPVPSSPLPNDLAPSPAPAPPVVEPTPSPPPPSTSRISPPVPESPATPPKRDTGQDYAYRVPPAPFQPSRPVQQLVQQAEKQRNAGDLVGAAATLERALRIEPRNAHLWNRLARVRLQAGNYRQADNLAAKSNALAGDAPSLKQDNWRIIASARRGSGDMAGAEAAEQRASGR